MKSDVGGKITLQAEITQIDRLGIWLLTGGKEFFLPYEKFPWFKNAAISEVQNVELVNERHVRWPQLDVDLALESIEHPERFPLMAKVSSNRRTNRKAD